MKFYLLFFKIRTPFFKKKEILNAGAYLEPQNSSSLWRKLTVSILCLPYRYETQSSRFEGIWKQTPLHENFIKYIRYKSHIIHYIVLPSNNYPGNLVKPTSTWFFKNFQDSRQKGLITRQLKAAYQLCNCHKPHKHTS